MNLVLIESTGNQSYIFSTNKLRENVGASELTAQVGTRFILDAVNEVCSANFKSTSIAPVRVKLRDKNINKPISQENKVEVILAVSGKALLLVWNEEIGKQIISKVTLRSIKEAPGLEVRGVLSRNFDFDKDNLHSLIGAVHRQFETVRSKLPGSANRFQRLPIIAECASSGLPAQRVAKKEDGVAKEQLLEYSAQTFSKIKARHDWAERLKALQEAYQSKERLPVDTSDLENLGCDWLGIVHADGNGLGQVFLDFSTKANTLGNRDYITKLRNFSLALDECTEKAFCHSLGVFYPRKGKTPVVPIVLGGDDLTVVCDGRQALQFTKNFIDCFEHETKNHSDINSIMKVGVTSCAGVAIVKPHFPFFAGYQLAKELLKSAKDLKPHSAIDYHILYDSSGPDLKRIRRELTIGTARLVARPYVVRGDNAPKCQAWNDLQNRIKAVHDRDEDDRPFLPNSMLHELREALYLGRDAAEARLKLIQTRYPRIENLLADGSLFWQKGDQYITGLLDAVDTAEFWEAQS